PAAGHVDVARVSAGSADGNRRSGAGRWRQPVLCLLQDRAPAARPGAAGHGRDHLCAGLERVHVRLHSERDAAIPDVPYRRGQPGDAVRDHLERNGGRGDDRRRGAHPLAAIRPAVRDRGADVRSCEGESVTMPVKVGILGCGFIGRIHALDMKADARVTLVGVADMVPQAAQRLAAEVNTKPLPWLEVLLDAGLEALYVCTPNTLHLDPVLRGLAAGVHVFSEKPMATSLPEAWKIRQAAGRARGMYQRGCNRRFAKWYRCAQQTVVTEELERAWFSPGMRDQVEAVDCFHTPCEQKGG